MNLSEYIDYIANYYRAHPLIAVSCGLLLLFVIARKPKLFLFVISLAVLLALLFQLIISSGSSSVTLKKKMINKGRSNSAD